MCVFLPNNPCYLLCHISFRSLQEIKKELPKSIESGTLHRATHKHLNTCAQVKSSVCQLGVFWPPYKFLFSHESDKSPGSCPVSHHKTHKETGSFYRRQFIQWTWRGDGIKYFQTISIRVIIYYSRMSTKNASTSDSAQWDTRLIWNK